MVARGSRKARGNEPSAGDTPGIAAVSHRCARRVIFLPGVCLALLLAPVARPAAAVDHLLALPDPLALGMNELPLRDPAVPAVDLEAEIPRLLHLVAEGDDAAPREAAWRAYAESAGFRFAVWQVNDDAAWSGLQRPEAWTVATELMRRKLDRFARDVMRYAVLARHGGVLVADTIAPPMRGEETVPLDQVVPLRGLVVTTAAQARNLASNTAIVVDDVLLMSIAGHPVILRALDGLPASINAWAGPWGDNEREYVTGAIYFSRALNGVFRVVPHTTWAHLGALPLALPSARPHLHPPYDPLMRAVPTRAAGLLARAADGFDVAAADRPVPKKVHQIWFGNPATMPSQSVSAWENLAEEQGWLYKLWSELDLPELRSAMSEQNRELFNQRLEAKRYPGASDIARLTVIEKYGGLYVDCDQAPPQAFVNDVGPNTAWLPLAAILPRRGLVLPIEHHGRNVGTSSLFVGNQLLMAPPHHPILAWAVATVARHATLMDGRDGGDSYATGPFFLNRCLEGGFSVIPAISLHRWGMH